MPLASGQSFAGYKILQLLGAGAMGEVYLAQHPRLPRRDALKVLGAEVSTDPDYRARFAREADLASTLWHPNIVGVHDRGEDDAQLWISMDYVQGKDAAQLLSELPLGLPPVQVAEIVSAIAGALDYAHERGLLHRDIKPANIMISADEQRIMLADFGIARDLNDISGLTATNITVGTVAYAAPEQLMGEDLDSRADQYALAATAYHLLTGTYLFPHTNPAAVIGRHLNSPPPRLADSRAGLANADKALATALAKDPGQRFAKSSDFARALSTALLTSAADAQDRRESVQQSPVSSTRFTVASDGSPFDNDASQPDPPPQETSGSRATGSGGTTVSAEAWGPPQQAHSEKSPPLTRFRSGLAPGSGWMHSRRRVALGVGLAVVLLASVSLAWHGLRSREVTGASSPIPQAAGPSSSAAAAPAQVVLPFSGLNSPSALAVDSQGAVYVADSGNNRVLRLGAGASNPAPVPIEGLNHPQALAIDKQGTLYVADSTDRQLIRVLKIMPGSSRPIVLPFDGLYGRVAVAVDPAGDLFVASAGTGPAVRELATGSNTPSGLMFNQVSDASGIAVDSIGNIFVTEQTPKRVWKQAAGSRGPVIIAYGHFGIPTAAAVDSDGNLYVTDGQNRRVMKLTPGADSPTVVPFTHLDGPGSVTVDSAGNLYVANYFGNQVIKLAATTASGPNTPSSVTTATTQATSAAEPPTLDSPCNDWDKLAADPATGEAVVCGAKSSPVVQLFWIEAPQLSAGIHVAGTACPGEPQYQFAKSTDNYMIWCIEHASSVQEPGGVTIDNPAGPIWALYSP